MARSRGNPSLRRPPRTTLRDVAAYAGVSVATSSHVANGRAGVSEKSRRAVLAAIEELQYIPNVVGKSINGKPCGLIGAVVPVAQPPLFPSIVTGLSSEAEKAGLPLFVSYSQDRSRNEVRSVHIFRQLFVNGIVLAGHTGPHDLPLILDTMDHGVPVVQVERRIPGLDTPFVGSCNFEEARDATSQLLAKGHQSVGMLAGPVDYSVYGERLAGYRKALFAGGCEWDPEWVYQADSDSGATNLKDRLLQYFRRENAPRALLCFGIHGQTLVDALDQAEEAGMGNRDVVLFDMAPDLHTKGRVFQNIVQDGFALGAAALRLLLQMANPEGPASREIRLPCQRHFLPAYEDET